jgi:hypothetical protein
MVVIDPINQGSSREHEKSGWVGNNYPNPLTKSFCLNAQSASALPSGCLSVTGIRILISLCPALKENPTEAGFPFNPYDIK